MAEALNCIIDEFSSQPMAAAKLMRDLLANGRVAFFDEALPILRAANDCQGFQYLLVLLLGNDLILDPLADPSIFNFDEAVTLAKLLFRSEPLLDIKMIRSMMASANRESSEGADQKTGGASSIRLLDLMAAISDGARILPAMTQLLNHPNPRVRSKAALIAGRSNKNHHWVEQRLSEPDSRVRANAVESLWGVNSEGSRGVFWGALTDSDCRVVGNAVLGLYRLGEALAVPLALDLVNHEQEKFRITGLWVVGESGDPRFRSVAARFLSDPNALIRASAFRCAAKLKKSEARFLEGPGADVRLFPATGAGSYWAHASATVWIDSDVPARKELVTGLKPTQFVLMESGQLVTEYEIEEVSHTKTLSVGFVAPRLIESDEGFQGWLERSFAATLSHKREGDAWLLLKYLPEQEIEALPSPAASGFSILRLEAQASETESTAMPAELRFLHDRRAIRAAAAELGTRMSWPHGIPQAARLVIPALAPSRGAKHLVIFHDPLMGVSRDADWDEVVRAARAARIAVHMIGPDTGRAHRDAAHQTGGTCHTLNSWDELPEALESLYALLVHRYQIRYRSPRIEQAGTKHDLALQVYSCQGSGNDTLKADPRAAALSEVA